MRRMIAMSLLLTALGAQAKADININRADVNAVVNDLRTQRCSGHIRQPLRVAAKLGAAARHVLKGVALRDALASSGYHADQSVLIVVSEPSGTPPTRMLQRFYCKRLTDSHFTELGSANRDGRFAIILAAPFAPPHTRDAAAVEREVLRLVNLARAKARRCGAHSFAAAPPVVLNARLTAAARIQAKDMAGQHAISHSGSDGSEPGDRATRAGYTWREVGENVASGQLTAQEVVDSWLTSPGHCANIMDPGFTEMGLAFAVDTRDAGIYWAQEFGRPR